jgi:2-haloacid dehalogenase
MEDVRTGRIPFSKLDVLHRHNLERILPRFGLADLSEDTPAAC